MDKNVVIFSLLTWDSKLLHRGHMLAKYFSIKGYQVYYVEKENITSPKQLNFKPKSYEDEGITVVKLPAFPYMKGKVKAIYTLNDKIMAKQLKSLFNSMENPLSLLESPNWVRAVNGSRDSKGILCYDISDDFLQFTTNETWKNILRDYEKETIEATDYIFVTAKELMEKAEDKLDKAYLVENGIDLNEFQNSKNILQEERRPICGFIGGLFQWIDYDLIEALAKRYPDYSFVLIGPTDQQDRINKLCSIENIQYLGEKDKSVIGDYFASLDIGLIPFVSEDEYPRLKTVNSNKIFQYCYFGYPVISTEFQQTRKLKEFIHVCERPGDFIEAVGEVLKSDNIKNKERRKEFAYNNSWAKRVDEIIHIVYKA